MTLNKKNHISQRQLAANRANALKSTGPRTPEGKATSSRNAFVPSILCPSPLLETEDHAAFLLFSQTLRDEFNPRSETEETLFCEIVGIKWQQFRYRQIEKEALNMAATEDDVVENFSRLEGLALSTQAHRWLSDHSRTLQVVNRQLARLHREFHKGMDLYLRLHGPLDQPSASAPPEPVQPKRNEPIPIDEHRPVPPSAPASIWIRKPKAHPAAPAVLTASAHTPPPTNCGDPHDPPPAAPPAQQKGGFMSR